jgi:hypothetical protein
MAAVNEHRRGSHPVRTARRASAFVGLPFASSSRTAIAADRSWAPRRSACTSVRNAARPSH